MQVFHFLILEPFFDAWPTVYARLAHLLLYDMSRILKADDVVDKMTSLFQNL